MPQEEIYEILYVLSPQLEEAEIEEVHKHITDIITASEGSIRRENKWGRRRLAYEVKKFREGYYIFVEFNGTGRTVKDLLDLFRVEKRIIRHLITSVPKAKLAEEERREELARTRAEEAKKQAEAARAAEEAEKAAEAAAKDDSKPTETADEMSANPEVKTAEEPAPAAESVPGPSQETAVSPVEPAVKPSQKPRSAKETENVESG